VVKPAGVGILRVNRLVAVFLRAESVDEIVFAEVEVGDAREMGLERFEGAGESGGEGGPGVFEVSDGAEFDRWIGAGPVGARAMESDWGRALTRECTHGHRLREERGELGQQRGEVRALKGEVVQPGGFRDGEPVARIEDENAGCHIKRRSVGVS